jgi:hypothetical protein
MNSEPPLIHPTTARINVARLTTEITAIRDRLIDEKAKLQSEHPNWKIATDIRLTCFSKFQNVLSSFQLGCVFWDMNLLSDEWWDKVTDYPEFNRPLLRREFQLFLKLGLVHFSFSAVESSLRIMMRVLDSTAYAGATVEFRKIYNDFFKQRLSKPMPCHIELLDMAAKLRNTVHNNGVYFHKSGKDATQNYKGRTYVFKHGQPIEFANWPLLLEITSDLVSMLVEVVRDPRIKNIPGTVVDPAS